MTCFANNDEYIITGSADKSLTITSASDYKTIHKINKAHNHVIKGIVTHPLGFASIANDGIIKIWTLDGNCIQIINAHTDSTVNFTYGLKVLPKNHNIIPNGIISYGEDGTVRIFNQQGNLIQKITLPGSIYMP